MRRSPLLRPLVGSIYNQILFLLTTWLLESRPTGIWKASSTWKLKNFRKTFINNLVSFLKPGYFLNERKHDYLAVITAAGVLYTLPASLLVPLSHECFDLRSSSFVLYCLENSLAVGSWMLCRMELSKQPGSCLPIQLWTLLIKHCGRV